MGAFLSVGKGSREPSVFLEMKYSGAQESDSPPLIFVGKGKCKLDQVACPFDMLIVPFLALNNAAPVIFLIFLPSAKPASVYKANAH